MELMEFVEQALKTDRTDRNKKYECLQIGLHGIAGEAGSVVSEAKKCLRDGRMPSSGIKENIREELGDLLWYIAFVSDQLEINLDDVAAANLKKTHALWSEELPELPDYDNHNYAEHKFLRRMTFRFEEDTSYNIPRIKMRPEGELAERLRCQHERKQHSSGFQIGNDLDDNAIQDDGYRYHDIIHLAHATVLGWSPVLRALIGAQRRHVGDCDRVQDGARAKAIEEGLVAFVFNYLAPYEFSTEHLDWTLFKHIRRTVRGLEVANQPVVAWRNTYEQAFQVFLKLRDNHGGAIECDLEQRRLIFSE